MTAFDVGRGNVGERLRFNVSECGEVFVETPQVRAVLDELFALLEVSRQKDARWRPHVCFVGPPGSGKTEVARFFMRAAQRAVSCALTAHLNDELRSLLEAPRLPSPDVIDDRQRHWSAFRDGLENARGHSGLCLAHCAPASWFPEGQLKEELRTLLVEGAYSAPVGLESVSPDEVRSGRIPYFTARSSPGNKSGDQRRRTTLVMMDDADRILLLRKDARRSWITRATQPEHLSLRWPVTYAFIGSPAIVDEVRAIGTVHVIRLEPMPVDADWRDLVRRIFGTDEAAERLHEVTQGCLGPLFYAARMQGLTPPYHVLDQGVPMLPRPLAD